MRGLVQKPLVKRDSKLEIDQEGFSLRRDRATIQIRVRARDATLFSIGSVARAGAAAGVAALPVEGRVVIRLVRV